MKKVVVTILLLGILAGIGYFLYLRYKTEEVMSYPYDQEVTITGNPSCAPHKNPGEFHTLECLMTLVDEHGNHYVYNTEGLKPGAGRNQFTVYGILRKPTGDMQRYDIVGILEEIK